MPESRYIGDTAVLMLSLTHPDTAASFNPTGHTLIFTLKRDAEQDDEDALIQKISTVGGIVGSSGSAAVTLVPDDWASLKAGKSYVADVQAQNNSTGAILTVWSGTLIAKPDVTKQATLSIPTYTTNPSSLLNKVDTFPASPTAAGTAQQYAIDDEGSLAICVLTGTEGNALWLKFSGSAEWS